MLSGEDSNYHGNNQTAIRHTPPARPFTAEESSRIQAALNNPIEYEHIQFRPSAQGNVAYVEGWRVLSLANEVFGFDGWSSEILSLSADFMDTTGEGRVSVGISCMVRVHLRDGTFHDDIGYGSAENQRSKAAAWEKARKEAVTDAMKRALRVFGNRLGNCAYDKAYLQKAKAGVKSNPAVAPSVAAQFRPAPTVNLSNHPAPIDFAPSWKHPKTSTTSAPGGSGIGMGIVATHCNSMVSEADSEPVVTEEQLLEFGTFFTEKIDYNDELMADKPRAPLNRAPLHHNPHNGSRAEFRSAPMVATVSLPANQFRPPH